MTWCALLTAVKNYNKSREKLQDFFFMTKTKTKNKTSYMIQDQDSLLSWRRLDYTKTLVCLEDYTTAL